MSIKKGYILSILALFLTVPWLISSSNMILGFPAWAFYSLIATVVYSFLIAYLFQTTHFHDHKDSE